MSLNLLLGQLQPLYTRVTLSAAQINALRETPIVVLNTSGVGLGNVVFDGVVEFSANAPFANGDVFYCWYGTQQPSSSVGQKSTCVLLQNIVPNMLAGTSVGQHSLVVNIPMPFSSITNQPLYVGLLSDAKSNWSGGGTSTMTLTLHYYCHPTNL